MADSHNVISVKFLHLSDSLTPLSPPHVQPYVDCSEEELRSIYVVVKNEQLIRISRGQDKHDPSLPYYELYK